MSHKTSKQRREQRKRAAAREEGIVNVQTTADIKYHNSPVAVVGFDMFGPFIGYPAAKTQPNKGEEKMNTAAIVTQAAPETQESKAFNRILSRMRHAFMQAETDLRKEYGLVDDERPWTPKEFLERVKAGKYILPENYEDARSYDLVQYFTWRDPKVEKDTEGFEKAFKALDTKYESAVDKIYVSTGEEGLKIYESFVKGK